MTPRIPSLPDTFLDAPTLTPTRRGVTPCQHAPSASPPRLARGATEGKMGGFPICRDAPCGHPVSPLKSVGERETDTPGHPANFTLIGSERSLCYTDCN